MMTEDSKQWPMPVLEMAATVMALETWGPLLTGRRVRVHTDCKGNVYALQLQRSKRRALMRLVRLAHSIAFSYRFHLSVSHIPGRVNGVADSASRLSEAKPPSEEELAGKQLFPALRVMAAGLDNVLNLNTTVALNLPRDSRARPWRPELEPSMTAAFGSGGSIVERSA